VSVAPISVVIPAHNAGAFLEEAILSVSAQTLRSSEIIVIADACSDRTSEIAAALDSKVIEIHSDVSILVRRCTTQGAKGGSADRFQGTGGLTISSPEDAEKLTLRRNEPICKLRISRNKFDHQPQPKNHSAQDPENHCDFAESPAAFIPFPTLPGIGGGVQDAQAPQPSES